MSGDATGARIVYVIEQDGYVKIGSTTSLKSRLASLQTGCAVPLRLVGTCTGGFNRERALQQEFGAWRRHGEWFKFPPEVMDTLMSRLTLAERPTAPLQMVPLREWQRTRNAAWDDRRRKMQQLTDDEAAAKEKAARYRRLRNRQAGGRMNRSR